jgi:hypothetical protein
VATVTVVTADRTLEIEATSIVDGEINAAGHLILTRHDGTPLDMGAVSGVQLDAGTTYAKADVFSYVGDTDPGAVPNGSVWFDTTGPTGPFASVTQQGLVELATNAETIAGTDEQRAVTPASLASVPGNKVQILAPNAVTETALPSAYPLGISQMSLTTSSGWSQNSGFGSVITYRTETDRTVQHFYSHPGGTGAPRMWLRQYHTSNNGGGWTSWSKVMTMKEEASTDASQADGITTYPTGWSRIYFDNLTSAGWDFSGKWGELVTYFDGGGFAKQTFTEHGSGSGTVISVWKRSGNGGAGWSQWAKFISDPGAWTPYTPTWTSQGSAQPSLGNAVLNCKYHKIGRAVTVKFSITFGSTTNFGTSPTGSDNWQFSLPVTAVNGTDDGLGFLEMYQNATNYGLARVKLYSTTGFRLGVSAGSTSGIGGDADSVTPFTWASGNVLRGTFTYESAV